MPSYIGNVPNSTIVTPGSGSFGGTLTSTGSSYTSQGANTINSVYNSIASHQVWGTLTGNISIKSVGISLSSGGKEIVKLTVDGKVEWANGIEIDEAAKAFSTSLNIGAELAAGLTISKQNSIRDKIFEEIIKVAESEGPLDATQLAFMLKSCKIMDVLKNKE